MIPSLKEILFRYILKNKLEEQIAPYFYLIDQYLSWKNLNYTECSSCRNITKKKFLCEICKKYYCLSCWDDYTYYCFYCNRHHCFLCNHKMRSCGQCRLRY